MRKIDLHNIKVSELVEGYIGNHEEGVRGYGGRLPHALHVRQSHEVGQLGNLGTFVKKSPPGHHGFETGGLGGFEFCLAQVYCDCEPASRGSV